MRITKEVLEEYGYHPGECHGCRCKKAGLQEQRPHSEECRQRIWEAMSASEHGREFRRKEEARINKKLEEQEEKK